MKKLIPMLVLLAILFSGCRPYSEKISSLDCGAKLSYVVEKHDPDTNYNYYLRTVDFASDSVTDTYLGAISQGELVYGDSQRDIRLRSYGDESLYRIHKISPDGSLSDESFCEGDYFEGEWVDKFYTGNLYDEYGLVDGAMITLKDYGSEILSYYPDGRALGVVSRDTGKTIADYSYKDEAGKLVTVDRPMKGYILGIENLQGEWFPILDFGEDTSIHKIAYAGWYDGENILFIGFDAEERAAFYRMNLSEKNPQRLNTAKGKKMEALAAINPSNSHITLSSDGRYAAYRPYAGQIMAVDLHTGKRCSVHSDVFNYQKEGVSISDGDLQFWH